MMQYTLPDVIASASSRFQATSLGEVTTFLAPQRAAGKPGPNVRVKLAGRLAEDATFQFFHRSLFYSALG
jgi:hypothetical protein